MLKQVQLPDCRLNVLDEGAGPALLLVHGFPLDHTMWRNQVRALSTTMRVLAPDLRGFGASTGAGRLLSMSQLADDLAALLSALVLNEPVSLCGLSMGGYVAFELWRRHRDRLARLVLCDTRAAADTAEGAQGRLDLAEKVLQEGAAPVAQAMLPKLVAETARVQNRNLLEELERVMLSTSPAVIAAALRGLAERADFLPLLSQIDAPALVICGEHDVISTPAEMRLLAAGLPRARYVEIAGAGHLAPLEAPDPVNSALREFLA